MRSTAGFRRPCFRCELRKQRSLAVVAMTMMRVKGKRDWYLAVYLATCRYWAPVHVHSRTIEGASMSLCDEVEVLYAGEGLCSYIDGARSVKSRIALVEALALVMVEGTRWIEEK